MECSRQGATDPVARAPVQQYSSSETKKAKTIGRLYEYLYAHPATLGEKLTNSPDLGAYDASYGTTHRCSPGRTTAVNIPPHLVTYPCTQGAPPLRWMPSPWPWPPWQPRLLPRQVMTSLRLLRPPTSPPIQVVPSELRFIYTDISLNTHIDLNIDTSKAQEKAKFQSQSLVARITPETYPSFLSSHYVIIRKTIFFS